MTPEAREIADRAADRAVEKLLEQVGVDYRNPRERAKFIKDMHFVRNWRESTESARGAIRWTFIATLLGGALGLVWLVVRKLLGGG